MDNYFLITQANVFEKLEKLIYGINTVYFEDDLSKDMTFKSVDALNLIFKMEIVSIKPKIEGEIDYSQGQAAGEFSTAEKEGYFDIVWKSRQEFPPLLTVSDISIEDHAKMAKDFETEILFNVHEGLLKHAHRMAVKHGVKFKGGMTQKFDGRAKARSVASRMDEALQKGMAEITFTDQDASPQTIRVYASNLSGLTGRKIRVVMENGSMKVIFKEASKNDILKNELERIWQRAVSEIGQGATEDIFRDVVAKHTLADEILDIVPLEADLTTSEVPESDLQPEPELLKTRKKKISKKDLPAAAETSILLDKPATGTGTAEDQEVVPLVLDEKSNQFFIPGTEPAAAETEYFDDDEDF